MNAGNGLAGRLRNGERLLGALVRMPFEPLVELAGLVGLDFVIIDTEHGPGDQMALAHHITAADAAGIGVIVRIGDPGEILRALDLGAAGILAPHISSVAAASELVSKVHYPPVGTRGFATYTRAGHYGLADARQHLADAEEHLLVWAMVEDSAGVEAAAGIAGVAGIDGILVGPADLAVAVGRPGRPDAPEVIEATRAVHAATTAAGRAVVSIVTTASGARAAFADGAEVVVYNTQAVLGGLFKDLAAVKTDLRLRPDPVVTPNEALVLLPGMLGGADSWAEVVAGLGEVARPQVCRIDLDDSVAGMADSVLAEAPERFALAGHSLGAIVALEIMARAPDRVSRLALLNASARPPSDEQLAAWEQQRRLVVAGEFAEVAQSTAPAGLSEGADPNLALRCQKAAHEVGGSGYLRQLAAQVTRPDGRPGLAAITVPTVVISGGEDRICPLDRQVELAAGIAGAAHEIVVDAGHHVALERPDEVVAILKHWLEDPS